MLVAIFHPALEQARHQECLTVPAGKISMPVTIDGNDALTAFPGISGNGTLGNPYTIEDTEFGNITGTMLTIRNVDTHLAISNCTFNMPGSHLASTIIVLENASNLCMDGCSLDGGGSAWLAIQLESCSNFTLANTSFAGSRNGIYLSSTSGITSGIMLVNNTFLGDDTFCTAMYGVANIEITNNTVDGQAALHVPDLEVLGNITSATGNVLNDKPVILVKDQSGASISGIAGQMIVVNSTRTTIANMTLDNASTFMYAFGNQELVLDNVTVNYGGVPDYAFIVKNTTSFIMRSSKFKNIDRGIRCTSCRGIRFDGNEMTNANAPLFIEKSTNGSITGNTFSNSTANLIDCSDIKCDDNHFTGRGMIGTRCARVSIENGTFLNAPLAIRLEACNDSTIRNCTFDNMIESGSPFFSWYVENTLCRNTTIANNTFSGFSGVMFLELENSSSIYDNVMVNLTFDYPMESWIVGSNAVDIHHNIVDGVESIGFLLYYSSRCTFRSNRISNGWRGIVLYESRHNTIDSNTFSSMQGGGVTCSESDHNNITTNTITGENKSASHGIVVDYCKDVLIEGNFITNMNESIYIGSSRFCLVLGNNCTGSIFGIVIADSSSNLINGCSFDGIEVQALRFVNGSLNNVTWCEFRDVGTCAFEDLSSFGNLFSNNTGCSYAAPLPAAWIVGIIAAIASVAGTASYLGISRASRIKTLKRYATTKQVTGNIIVKIDDVTKDYRIGTTTVHALRGITLEIEKGELACLMGPSGSGKSTLINIIATLDGPTSGSMYLNGKPVYAIANRQASTPRWASLVRERVWVRTRTRARTRGMGNTGAIAGGIAPRSVVLPSQAELAKIRRLQIGIVYQKYNLIEVLTAVENVMLPMTILDTPTREKRAKAMTLLEMVGLKGKEGRLPLQLSGGEQQRVCIARALVNDPLIVLADEPTGNLDQQTGKEIIKLFERLNTERGQTFLVVTHDPAIASRAHRILKIRDGKIET